MWAVLEYHIIWAHLHRCLSWRQRKACASWAWLARCHVKSQEGRSYDGKLGPESDSDTQTSFTFASVSESEECLGHNVSDVTLCNTTKTSAPAPSARILASDWLRVIMWPGCWPLICWEWSCDQDTGLWLAYLAVYCFPALSPSSLHFGREFEELWTSCVSWESWPWYKVTKMRPTLPHFATLPVLPPQGPGDWGQAPGTFIAFIELSGDIETQKGKRFKDISRCLKNIVSFKVFWEKNVL